MSELVTKFDSIFGGKSAEEKKTAIVNIIRIAEATERYEDMCALVKKLVEMKVADNEDLTIDERNLLSVAYKNAIGARRSSWRTLNQDPDSTTPEVYQAYKAQIEKELEECSVDVLSILTQLESIAANHDAQVFYYKMTGDYKRYLAECFVDNESYGVEADEKYKKAMEIAEKEMPPTNPIRLGLALNYSVCCYEILKKKELACNLAKSAFDEAISKLDKLDEGDYKDSTLIMQLLRDNLTLWTSEATQDNGVTVEDFDD